MWNAPTPHPTGIPPTSNQPHDHHTTGGTIPKWATPNQAVKEEPKNNIPLPGEILENSSGSPHVVNQTSSPSSQHIGGYGSPGGTPTPGASASLAAAVAAGFSDVVFTSSNVSVNNQDHLIYDSIGMSQVQNYSPSLSSSLGKSSYLTYIVERLCFFVKKTDFRQDLPHL